MLDALPDPTPPKARSEKAEREAYVRWAWAKYERFCGLLEIIPKSGLRCKLSLNKVQREYNRHRTARDVILKARQVTMTTGEQARDIWHFLTVPGARVALMCQSVADKSTAPSRELAIRFNVMFSALESVGVRLDFKRRAGGFWELGGGRDAVLKIVEAGASELAADKKGRSGTITRLHATEPAFWEFAGSTMNAAMECVPDPKFGSEVVLESTPNGAQGYYYDTYQAASTGRSPFKAHFFPWYWCDDYQTPLDPGEVIGPHEGPTGEQERALVAKGVTAEQLKWRRLKLAEKNGNLSKLNQEYPSDPETCFLVDGGKFFDTDALMALNTDKEDPQATQRIGQGVLRIWEPPIPGCSYVIGADTSEGISNNWDPLAELRGEQKPSETDGSAAIIREARTSRHVATLWGMWRPWDFADPLSKVGAFYNNALVAVERNNHGHTTLRALMQERGYRNVFHDSDRRPGWNNVGPRRAAALGALEEAYKRAFVPQRSSGTRLYMQRLSREQRHAASEIDTPDAALISQLGSFVVRDGKPQAAKGAHDDLVMADCIAFDMCCRREAFRDTTNLPSQ